MPPKRRGRKPKVEPEEASTEEDVSFRSSFGPTSEVFGEPAALKSEPAPEQLVGVENSRLQFESLSLPEKQEEEQPKEPDQPEVEIRDAAGVGSVELENNVDEGVLPEGQPPQESLESVGEEDRVLENCDQPVQKLVGYNTVFVPENSIVVAGSNYESLAMAAGLGAGMGVVLTMFFVRQMEKILKLLTH